VDELVTESARERFLSLIPRAHRNALAQLHHQGARFYGGTTPERLAAIVRAKVGERAGSGWRGEQYSRDWEAIRQLLLAEPPEWLEYRRWVIAFERLPVEEQERIKRERGEEHRRRYLENRPPTPKQLAYLRRLGYHSEVATGAEASQLIDRLLARRGRAGGQAP
jgi:hypothetical protein